MWTISLACGPYDGNFVSVSHAGALTEHCLKANCKSDGCAKYGIISTCDRLNVEEQDQTDIEFRSSCFCSHVEQIEVDPCDGGS